MSQSSSNDLQQRILFTLAILIVCRIGSFIPIPGIDSIALAHVAEQHQAGILGMFNMLSGGSLGRMSIFALAIMPYITSSIIIQLLGFAYKPLADLKKEGEAGRRKTNQITRYLTVFLASFQAFGVARSLLHMSAAGSSVVVISPMFFQISTVVTLVVGTMFLMWLGEQISARGIGNGISLIIFAGIVSGVPSTLISTFELSRTGAISPLLVILLLLLIIAMVTMIIFFERAQRRVLVQYPKRQVGMKMYGGEATHMPLKLNTSGVIPPIFANALLLFPSTIAGFSGSSDSWFSNISLYLGHGKPLYILLYAFLITFFCFFYTAVVFNAEETANNLKKHGAYIPGRRPGKHTADFFDYLLVRLTVLGAMYLAVICIVPEVLMSKYSIALLSLSGTSLLIVVNVVIDTFSQIQTHLFSSKYESLMKKAKFREKKA